MEHSITTLRHRLSYELLARLGQCPCCGREAAKLRLLHSKTNQVPRCPQRTEMVMQLRQSRAGRRRRSRGRQRFVGLQDFTPIALRPAHVESRQEPGHWEGDIVEGARGTRPVVATLVERSSRLVRLALLPDGTAGSLLHGLSTKLRLEAPWMRRSITYDRGTEMACHKALATTLGINIYICDAYHPWQRGANENTNGLIRQYLPKGMDLSQITPADLLAIEFLLNNRPRRVLGYPPDFIVELQSGERLVVEIKGQLGDAEIKAAAAHRWCHAVNNDGRFGRWSYHLVTQPANLLRVLDKLALPRAA